MRIIVFLCIMFSCFIMGCAKKEVIKAPPPEAKDTKRIESYNKLDNLKEGVWRVDEWKETAKKICQDSKERDCSVMAEIYHDRFYGYGSRGDRQKAIQMLVKSCSLNDSKSCLKLSSLADQSDYPVGESETFFKKAHDLALKGCNANYALDCHVLALLYFEGHGEFERDRAKSKEYAHKACNMKHAGSCIFIGINGDTHEEALEAHKKACVLGIKAMCK
ncbi:tetratricopeptide repeat protein [Helicobacter bilis]|uniref:Beta-lactamase n=1 Tax=Helicobacter bilis TaxID=37372 RepID=A0A4U8U9D6_9HELI|nr:sel1 repeat family protein [Helicobacter bilis]MCI7411350.1 sel1 repeat family protein [Helicobacter bilis]MDD7296338.1 sel1 repeat family protein [Helicobacter bilis]MDY4399835.1 sel1 repeat family protein [Helicobacter bilis]TLE08853.1 sel1 repeat family protein [Helicobacter bilis]TLE10803.1 sel1 repeat family protein [Helicobacter bilis]